jgi:hypothetical protein
MSLFDHSPFSGSCFTKARMSPFPKKAGAVGAIWDAPAPAGTGASADATCSRYKDTTKVMKHMYEGRDDYAAVGPVAGKGRDGPCAPEAPPGTCMPLPCISLTPVGPSLARIR